MVLRHQPVFCREAVCWKTKSQLGKDEKLNHYQPLQCRCSDGVQRKKSIKAADKVRDNPAAARGERVPYKVQHVCDH